MLKEIEHTKTCNETILSALGNAYRNLSGEAVSQIRAFLLSRLHEQGGFVDRAGNADPYYSVFGYTLSFVFDLDIPVGDQKRFLQEWASNNEIDLVHAVSLVQCWLLVSAIEKKMMVGRRTGSFLSEGFLGKALKSGLIKSVKQDCAEWLKEIETYRSQDKGYHHNRRNSEFGSVYAAFLVWSLYQELKIQDPCLEDLLASQGPLQQPDGSFSNERGAFFGVTSATSAALILMVAEGRNRVEFSVEWLKGRWMAPGGFAAAEQIPIADLLSTATALLALKMTGESMAPFSDDCSEFINLHWDDSGGFFGSIADMKCDVEYSYYALLALGLILND